MGWMVLLIILILYSHSDQKRETPGALSRIEVSFETLLATGWVKFAVFYP
jgi:hypothetical protein